MLLFVAHNCLSERYAEVKIISTGVFAGEVMHSTFRQVDTVLVHTRKIPAIEDSEECIPFVRLLADMIPCRSAAIHGYIHASFCGDIF